MVLWVRLRAWIARWRAWGRRVVAIEALLASPAGRAASFVVGKIARDPSWHPTKNHAAKRAEALEWALLWWGEHERGRPLPTWDVMFCVEWLVGERKGRL